MLNVLIILVAVTSITWSNGFVDMFKISHFKLQISQYLLDNCGPCSITVKSVGKSSQIQVGWRLTTVFILKRSLVYAQYVRKLSWLLAIWRSKKQPIPEINHFPAPLVPRLSICLVTWRNTNLLTQGSDLFPAPAVRNRLLCQVFWRTTKKLTPERKIWNAMFV